MRLLTLFAGSMHHRLALPAILLAVPAPALAEVPGPVRAMIDAAIAAGDEATVKTVIDLAKQTNPGETPAIEALGAQIASEQQETGLLRVTNVIHRWPDGGGDGSNAVLIQTWG